MIYISHFLEEVRQISDRFTVSEMAAVSLPPVTFRPPAMMAHHKDGGRAQQNLFPVRTPTAGTTETILEVQNPALPPLLKNARFELRRGEILGIAGLMGSGRTPLLQHNLRSRTSGEWNGS